MIAARRLSALVVVGALGCGGASPAPATAAPPQAAAEAEPPAPSAEEVEASNPVLVFLRHASLQNGDASTAPIRQAFHDWVYLEVDELRQRRYADHRGNEGAWDLYELLQRNFVPESLDHLRAISDEEVFWQHAGDEQVRHVALSMIAMCED